MTMTGEHLTDVRRIRGLEMPWNRILTTDTPPSLAQAFQPLRPQEFLAECVAVACETNDMMSFVFRRVDGAPMVFRPGQYLNIDVPVYGPDQEPVSRSYSISSAPTTPWTFSISVKRDHNGLVSPWIHENVRPGTVLDMLGPVGAFHLPDADRRARYLFLAAGAGITPILSMIRTIHSLPGHADVVVLYHASAPADFAFWHELTYLATTDRRMKISFSVGDRGVPGQWAGLSGRLSASMIEDIAPDANGRQVYACGPEGYLAQAQLFLDQLGVDASSIHVEYFSDDVQALHEYRQEIVDVRELVRMVPESISQTPASQSFVLDRTAIDHKRVDDMEAAKATKERGDHTLPNEDSAEIITNFETVGTGQFVMTFTRSGKNVRIDAGEKVLNAALDAGIRIPMNCRQGMCGSCKSVKIQGEVDMHHQGGIRAREIEAGKFLPCCSTPCSDLIIEA